MPFSVMGSDEVLTGAGRRNYKSFYCEIESDLPFTEVSDSQGIRIGSKVLKEA